MARVPAMNLFPCVILVVASAATVKAFFGLRACYFGFFFCLFCCGLSISASSHTLTGRILYLPLSCASFFLPIATPTIPFEKHTKLTQTLSAICSPALS